MNEHSGKVAKYTKKDFRLEWFSGTGGGGQHRNKHQNCCRITHIASGLRAQSTKYRERVANQKAAFTRLVGLMLAHEKVEKERVHSTEEVRVYKEPRNEVIDHASGLRMRYTDVVGSPNIGPMIEARKKELSYGVG